MRGMELGFLSELQDGRFAANPIPVEISEINIMVSGEPGLAEVCPFCISMDVEFQAWDMVLGSLSTSIRQT